MVLSSTAMAWRGESLRIGVWSDLARTDVHVEDLGPGVTVPVREHVVFVLPLPLLIICLALGIDCAR